MCIRDRERRTDLPRRATSSHSGCSRHTPVLTVPNNLSPTTSRQIKSVGEIGDDVQEEDGRHDCHDRHKARTTTGALYICLLYTSDAADDLTRVDLGGRRIIKRKKQNKNNKN